MTDVSPTKLALSVDETAQALGISRSLAYELVARGRLPHIRLGRRILIPTASINQLLHDPSAPGSAGEGRNEPESTGRGRKRL